MSDTSQSVPFTHTPQNHEQRAQSQYAASAVFLSPSRNGVGTKTELGHFIGEDIMNVSDVTDLFID